MNLLNNAFIKAKSIKLLILDVDGVLTDGGLYIDAQGQELKRFNSLDGHGIKLLQKAGVDVAIISARNTKAVAFRMKNLGVNHIYQGKQDKRTAFNALIKKLKLTPQQTAYVGDDVLDLTVMTQVGLSIAVSNAHALVKEHADMLTQCAGGQGAVREVCDFIMNAQGTYQAAIAPYLE